ncbi:MAG: lactate/malate dehydrogenase family protein [Candidatus Aenigmarchaeota archaeon]|nr:lactate/malate dehydrogenase family protein [Candidatus Aenigmarchaeota archaeon]
MANIAIIGSGNLGSCIAYTVALKGLATRLILHDKAEGLAEGHVLDLVQAFPSEQIDIRAGSLDDCLDSDIAIVSAGLARSPNTESRLELAATNLKIIKGIAQGMHGYEGIAIVLTNPTDVMNYFFQKHSGIDRHRVIGSAGLLDTARFRSELAKASGLQPHQIDAMVIGEHGDRQVPLFGLALANGKGINVPEDVKRAVRDGMRNMALDVIRKKGATIYGPASMTAMVAESIVKDGKQVLPCSAVLDGEYGLSGISIGVPCVIGTGGIEGVVEFGLDWEDEVALKKAAESLKQSIGALETG